MLRLLTRLWVRWFADAVRKVEAESLAYRLSEDGRRFDFKTVAVLLTAAVCLAAQNYFLQFLPQVTDQLTRLTWWVGGTVFTYAIVPVVVIRWGFRERVRDYGVKWAGVLEGGPIYLGFVVLMAPLVWVCSAGDRFQETYPFYRLGPAVDWPGLARWELLYAVQFAALEFFFRGFLIHGTKHRFGAYSVVVMTVPYCMIHFSKPPAECLGSVVAGLALGLMSLKTRSVWLGAALHVSVAWGMDAAVLLRRGLVF